MARISISVSEELMARLDPIKDRINISELCREAIERRLAAHESVSNNHVDELDQEGLIQRLREERELSEGTFQKGGRAKAALWLSTAPFLEIKSVAEARTPSNMESYRLPQTAFRMMKKHMEEAGAECDGIRAVVHKTAWLDYVTSVWSQVVSAMDEKNHADPEGAIINGVAAQ